MLDVAEVLFQRHGYHGVTVEDVTTALGVKKPNLYNHFRDKSDLYIAVRLRRLNRLGSDLATAAPTESGFKARLLGVVAAMLRHPFFLAALVNRDSETFLSEQTRDILFARAFGGIYEPVTGLLRAGIASGDLPLDSEGIPFAYEALIALVAHFGAGAPLESRPDYIAATASRIARFFLEGVSVAAVQGEEAEHRS
jgi:AcrR family transcriptional regulator